MHLAFFYSGKKKALALQGRARDAGRRVTNIFTLHFKRWLSRPPPPTTACIIEHGRYGTGMVLMVV
jgi:hypothetical protein